MDVEKPSLDNVGRGIKDDWSSRWTTLSQIPESEKNSDRMRQHEHYDDL